MPKSRPLVRQGPATSILLTVRENHRKPKVLRSVQEALEAVPLRVQVSVRLTDYSNGFDLVAMLDGWEQLALEAALRQLQRRLPSVPTLAIHTTRSRCAELLDAGFDDCVAWPRDAVDLGARVRACIHQPSLSEAVILDPQLMTLHCEGTSIRFTPAEFRLMRRLFATPDMWVAKSELFEATSTPGRRSGGTTVALHVYAIRRKLGPAAWRLENDRGLGYRFVTRP